MLIFRQKSFQFCTPRLKTQQPVLPYFRYTVFITIMSFYFQYHLETSFNKIFPLHFLGQLTVPHDVISSSGVGDSALPGHPVRVGGSGAGNNFEMSPLLSHEQMKDSIITLDYVSLIQLLKVSKSRKQNTKFSHTCILQKTNDFFYIF